MTFFAFNSATSAGFATGNYYAVLVSTQPTPAMTVRSQLSEFAVAPVALTGKVLTATSLTFDDFVFPIATYPVSVLGMVIVQKLGAQPASTDTLLSYSALRNSLGQVYVSLPGTYAIPVDFGAQGAIIIKSVYRYSSGAYLAGANGGFPFGLMYLLGTKNNTVLYVNPDGSPQYSSLINTSGSPNTVLTNRAAGSGAFGSIYGFNFENNRIRIGEFAVRENQGPQNVTLYGSNDLVGGFTPAGLNNNANWTTLGSGSTIASTWALITPNDTVSYWKYFRITAANSLQTVDEIEFYNSTIESATVNFA